MLTRRWVRSNNTNHHILHFLKAVAKKIASGKLSLAAYGNLANVPYVEAL